MKKMITNWLDSLPPGKKSRYGSKEMITVPGTGKGEFFLLLNGQARVFLLDEDKEQTLGYLKPGSIYVSHTPAWVEAIEPCELQSWPLSKISALFASQPELALGAFREIGMLLQSAIELVSDLAFRSVEGRLARYLLAEVKDTSDLTIELVGSTETLATLLGSSRQTLSTIINRFEKQGLIERLNRQQIRILQRSALEALSAS